VFCRVLDAQQGGFFRVAPAGDFSSERQYRGHTNVLETTLSNSRGRVRLTDFMSLDHRLLRRVEGLAGEMDLEIEYKPTFDFARAGVRGDEALRLRCDGVEVEPNAVKPLTLRSGEKRWFVITRDKSREDGEQQLQQAIKFWEDWAGQCTYRGPYSEQVLRSALVLKLLTYEPSGAVVAAPTTSLPEQIGGERNWDYRFTWLRDASLILYALVTIGYDDAATRFMRWLERTIGSDPTRRPQIMYGIEGERNLAEQILDHLEGYRGQFASETRPRNRCNWTSMGKSCAARQCITTTADRIVLRRMPGISCASWSTTPPQAGETLAAVSGRCVADQRISCTAS
jgi:GH15 family glucan-1,4-alpha-glucosidase